MKQSLTRIKSISKDFIPKSSKIAMASLITSFLFSLACSIIVYFINKNGYQVYNDIAVGNITLPGVNKSIDFYVYYTFIFSYFIAFPAFTYIFNKKAASLNESIKEVKLFNAFIGLLPFFLMLLFRLKVVPMFNICFFAFFAVTYFKLKEHGLKTDNIIKIILSFYFAYLSLAGLLAFANYYFPVIVDKNYKYFIPILWVIFLVSAYIACCFTKKNKIIDDNIIDRIVALSQLIIPFILFSLINTRYFYQGTPYTPVYYERFKICIFILIVILCLFNINSVRIAFTKKKRLQSVSLSTILSFVSVCYWNTGYNLLINTDQFHTGEIAIIYQQIIDFGQKWGKEFVSVLQGLGFVISGLNEFVFGGAFSTYIQANNLLLVIVAILTVILLYQIIEQKWIILLIAPIMPLFLMDRTYLIAPVFLFLINKKMIKKPILWTFGYILTCIIYVWYQPSYGGAVAASLIPVLLFIWYKDIKSKHTFNLNEKRDLFKFSIFLLIVLVIGLVCIPMLIQVLHFLKTNGYETQIGNGASAMQYIFIDVLAVTDYPVLNLTIFVFIKFGTGLLSIIIMLYMFFRYVVKTKDATRKVQGIILTVSTVISYILMIPAFFTRIDPGLSRITAVGYIYFGFLTLIILYLYKNEINYKPLAFLVMGISLATSLYITNPPYLQIHEKAVSVVTIPDNAIYAKPEETGLKNLGYAFTDNEMYLQEAMTVNEICNALLNENQTYYDLTDKSIYYLLTDHRVPGLYVSPLVCSNELLQTEAIEQLNKNDVPIVFINNPLNYIGVSQSLRSYRIYKYFVEKDYRFVKYKNCDFLVRSDIDLSPIENDIEYIALDQIGAYDRFINEFDYNSTLMEKLSTKNITFTNSVEAKNDKMYTAGPDPYVVFSSKKQLILNDIKLIEIKLKGIPVEGMEGQLFVDTEAVAANEYNSIHFDIKSNRIVIPTYLVEQFNMDSKLINIRVDFDNVPDGTDITIDSISLYSLTENQKANINQQLALASESINNYRLDDIFHQPNLMYLPREWGNNSKTLEKRFQLIDTAVADKEQADATDTTVKTHFEFTKSIAGNLGEFLQLNMICNNNECQDVKLIVKGIDKEGNELLEEFYFIASNGYLIIPIASSPNCLRAQRITGFDIILSPDITVEEAKLHHLIK